MVYLVVMHRCTSFYRSIYGHKICVFSYLNHRKIDDDEKTMLELRERSLIELCQLRKEEENNASPRSQSNLGLVRMLCYVKIMCSKDFDPLSLA